MCPTQWMCRAHLLGEHRELHALVGIIRRGTSLDGYAANGLIETGSILARHEQLVAEMTARGYQHHSPLIYQDDISFGVVDRESAATELARRCSHCRSMMPVKNLPATQTQGTQFVIE